MHFRICHCYELVTATLLWSVSIFMLRFWSRDTTFHAIFLACLFMRFIHIVVSVFPLFLVGKTKWGGRTFTHIYFGIPVSWSKCKLPTLLHTTTPIAYGVLTLTVRDYVIDLSFFWVLIEMRFWVFSSPQKAFTNFFLINPCPHRQDCSNIWHYRLPLHFFKLHINRNTSFA